MLQCRLNIRKIFTDSGNYDHSTNRILTAQPVAVESENLISLSQNLISSNQNLPSLNENDINKINFSRAITVRI